MGVYTNDETTILSPFIRAGHHTYTGSHWASYADLARGALLSRLAPGSRIVYAAAMKRWTGCSFMGVLDRAGREYRLQLTVSVLRVRDEALAALEKTTRHL